MADRINNAIKAFANGLLFVFSILNLEKEKLIYYSLEKKLQKQISGNSEDCGGLLFLAIGSK